ncbi:hypothetical protein DKX38_004243 [Salix brachista]|uniref:Tobamovirus multiplication protein 2A n=1 Tax=Salix brachista TaxID=2182728 RepID=A0A5N5NAA1_9ROSI|nr:hypothetical protein DKX38_004243 [Salix brachista]
MACKGCLEWLLKLLNILLTLVGLAMIGYGIYLFVEYTRTDDNVALVSTLSDGQGLTQLGRPMLMAVSLSDSISDKLSKAWFIYVFVAVGIILFIISCFGCIGAATGNGCCLTCYSILIVLLILVELGCAAFIFFDKSWKEEIPTDKTGDFGMVYDFLKENWNIVKWVALGIVILEVWVRAQLKMYDTATSLLFSLIEHAQKRFKIFIDMFEFVKLCFSCTSSMAMTGTFVKAELGDGALIFLLALVVRAANRPLKYDSDDELIAPRQQNQQPLLNRPPGPASGVPVAGTTDQRPSRNDAWSTRMREKGLHKVVHDKWIFTKLMKIQGLEHTWMIVAGSIRHCYCIKNYPMISSASISGSDSTSVHAYVLRIMETSMGLIRPSSRTTHPRRTGSSQCLHSLLRKSVVAPSCDELMDLVKWVSACHFPGQGCEF